MEYIESVGADWRPRYRPIVARHLDASVEASTSCSGVAAAARIESGRWHVANKGRIGGFVPHRIICQLARIYLDVP